MISFSGIWAYTLSCNASGYLFAEAVFQNLIFRLKKNKRKEDPYHLLMLR